MFQDFIQRPLWDWGEQFSEQDIALFYNPLYNISKPADTPKQRICEYYISNLPLSKNYAKRPENTY